MYRRIRPAELLLILSLALIFLFLIIAKPSYFFWLCFSSL